MMAKTYEPIAKYTVSGTSTASYSFTSISQNYTDIIVVMNYGGSSATDVPYMRYNSDTGSNYSVTSLYGPGNGNAYSTRSTSQTFINISKQAGFESSVNDNAILQIQNYSNATTYKTALHRVNVTGGSYPAAEAVVSLWRSTSAITSITLFTSGGYWADGSTFALYGIKAA